MIQMSHGDIIMEDGSVYYHDNKQHVNLRYHNPTVTYSSVNITTTTGMITIKDKKTVVTIIRTDPIAMIVNDRDRFTYNSDYQIIHY
jgi:6-phosphogluconate dehydrogenase (decarboxylating)